jgi:high-affinity nickel-transport protein
LFDKIFTARPWAFYALFVAALHITGFALLFFGAQTRPILFGIGLIAYTLGLRHAFDADHITAIDNTVRKLLQQNKNPDGVGFYFSLGHSSVVFLSGALIALSVHWIRQNLAWLQDTGGMIGGVVSGGFLMLIGTLNLFILIRLLMIFFKIKSCRCNNEQVEHLLAARGFLSRIFAPLLKIIGKSRHAFPLGFLFGLGFDTAGEIALLAMSAGAMKQAVSPIGILALPILFASGMCLLDTADGMFMKTAYRWAFSHPLRKIYYNVTVTAFSVAAAWFIGFIELGRIATMKWQLSGPLWSLLTNFSFNRLGYALAALFLFAWLLSFGFWKLLKLEKRWDSNHLSR